MGKIPKNKQLKNFILLCFFVILILISANSKASKEEESDGSPLLAMERIYRETDPDVLFRIFKTQYMHLRRNPELYRTVLREVCEKNDNVNISALDVRSTLGKTDQIRLAIRMSARAIFRMGDIDNDGFHLLKMARMLDNLPDTGIHTSYFYEELYYALAKNSPRRLLDQLNDGKETMWKSGPPWFVNDPHGIALALLRKNCVLSQSLLKAMLQHPHGVNAIALTFYIDDVQFKLGWLDSQLRVLHDLSYVRKSAMERELVNAMLSFPEGVERLKTGGAIDNGYVEFNGVYFGSLSGSMTATELSAYAPIFRKAAVYIQKSNGLFGGREKINFVDITPNEAGGRKLNKAGWGDNSLYMTKGALVENTPRTVVFTLLHEACEQRSAHGVMSAALGLSYLEASRTGVYEDLRLGRRIGGIYEKGNLGHPWDSEREWLAECASAVIIGEKLPLRTASALKAAQELFTAQ